MKNSLLSIVKTVVFAAVAIVLGSWMIDHSLEVSTKEYQNLLGPRWAPVGLDRGFVDSYGCLGASPVAMVHLERRLGHS